MGDRVCDLFSIRYPIIQGPMAFISNSSLVAAVSEAGGLGVLGVGFAPPEVIAKEIRDTKALTKKPFGANVQLIPEMLQSVNGVILENPVPVVYADTINVLDYDLAKRYFDIWHEKGMKVLSKVGFLGDAITAEKAGADAIIVKGWEGGGHVTLIGTMALVPQAADVISVPLIASGGIGDGRGMAAALILGAQGIELGTAFMLADECPAHPNVKKAMIAAGDNDTVVVGMCTDEPCRQIRNKLSDEIACIEAGHVKAEAAEKLKPVAASSLMKAMLDGDVEETGAVMAGQIVGLLKRVKPVKSIIGEIISDCRALLSKVPDLAV
jgi:enoyl-[acyl-carrier protein] reductase II